MLQTGNILTAIGQAFPKLTQLLQEQSGTVAVLSLGLSLLLGWDAIARRYVLLKQETAVENAAGDADRDAVGDAEVSKEAYHIPKDQIQTVVGHNLPNGLCFDLVWP